MTARNRATRTKPSEEEIDKIVMAQADDDSAWEEPIQVEMAKAASLSIPAKLAARAAFLVVVTLVMLADTYRHVIH